MEGCGVSWRKGPWTPEEDKLLVEYVSRYGDGRWSCVSKCAGLNRSGKSCRLRWVNYLRPGLKRGHITPQEEGIIIELHALLGNKWSSIARYLPGRTDNEIKNYWRTHFKKRSSCDHKRQQQQRGKDSNDSSTSNLEDQQRADVGVAMRHEEETQRKRETVSENQQQDYSTKYWSHYFVPATHDNYLFADHNGCTKMAIQNQANIDSYPPGGGDAVNYYV